MNAFAASSADEIYRRGPESLLAESQAVVAGRVTHYVRTVTSASAGAEPIPLTWTVAGDIGQPIAIKGRLPSQPLVFSRREQSMLEQPDPGTPDWELELGEVRPDGPVVAFYGAATDGRPATVLPGGDDPAALVALLRDLVSIQALGTPDERAAAWLDYLRRGRSEAGRMAALRSLIGLGVPWTVLAPALDQLNADPATGASLREFIFGSVAFAVVQERFGDQQGPAVQFLCRTWLAAADARTALTELLHLKLVLRYTGQTEGRQARLPLERQIIDALNQRAAAGALPAELAEQYRQIRQTHPEVR